ncbi:MAG: BON domain-containing protein [Asticcacaulis sp.]|uniref:BON domain-containing protein n=1 Tax=Asticcacaulis sp. TaxID=1872648 RepID=UPI003F7CC1F1
MNDLQLRQDILDELAFDPGIDAARIAVAVARGVATLAGTVGSYAEKVTAEKIALRVKGVLAVAQDIKVVYPEDKKTGDAEIARRALDIIAWDARLPEGQVKVKVQSGWVTLEGKVDWQFQKDAAAEAVHRLSGVTGVSNHLLIAPPVSSDDIKRNIENALRRYAALEADAIRVEVSGGQVTLEGKVSAWHERGIAEHAAWSTRGVASVADHLALK